MDMPMIVVTACYSDGVTYDEPKSPPPGADACYAFTDDVRWFDAGWSQPPVRNNLELSPRYRGKAPKVAPHLFFEEVDVLWIDASMQTTGRDVRALRDLVPAHNSSVGCFRHRFRTNIFDEADASLVPGFTRYVKEPIREQVEHYRKEGIGKWAGLWEMGIIMWRGAQYVIGERWLAEMLAWTSQDQLSFPRVATYLSESQLVTFGWREDMSTISVGTVIQNPWFTYKDHLKIE